MLDIWVQGDCTKVSPEASALVLKEYTRNHNVGGAGNLALNLSNLGADTHLYGSVGNDAPGHKIQEILLENSIKTYLCQDGSATTTKTRMIGPDGQHLLRLDKEEEYTHAIHHKKLYLKIYKTMTLLLLVITTKVLLKNI